MAYNKVFFHGAGPGIGDMVRQCDAAGIPVLVKSIANEGWAVEVSDIRRNSGVEHTIIYRDPNPLGAANDLPDFDLSPQLAAEGHWNTVKQALPTGVKDNKDLIWIEPTNEIDTNTKAEWLADFCLEIAKLMNADGYMAALSGFNAGQPEPEHWTAYFGDFLSYASRNRDKVMLTLHEGFFFSDYLTEPPDNEADFPWIIGRFEFMHDACDQMGIAPYPLVVLSEWAWNYRDMPPEDKAKSDIEWLSEYLAGFENVKGACLWNLEQGSQWGNLPDRLAQLIPWVRDYTLTVRWPDPIPPPDPSYRAVVVKLPQESSVDEWVEAAEYAYGFRHTITASTDDMLAVLFSGSTDSYVKVAWPSRPSQVEAIEMLNMAGYAWEPLFETIPEPPTGPLDGVVFGQLFRVPYIMTSPFNAPRPYANGLHEGADYDIFALEADSKELVLNVFPGLVVFAGNNNDAYGWHVIVQHDNGNGPFRTWYCHMDNVKVTVGDYIMMGRPVGELGDTGGNWAEHVHFNLQVPGFGLGGYVVSDVVDPAPFIPDFPPPPDQDTIDLMSFMRANPFAWRVVQHPAGNTEDFRDYDYGDGRWAMVKNSKAEFWRTDGTFIYLEKDTSPAPADDGTERFYVVSPGRWAKRSMAKGETYNDGGHYVQFYNINTCVPHPQNSGVSMNNTTVMDLKLNHTFNKYGQNLTLDEVLFLKGNQETQIFARHQGEPLGRVGWVAPWGESEIVALYWDRGKLELPPFDPC